MILINDFKSEPADLRQAMLEQKSASAMISGSAEQMVQRIDDIAHVASDQAAESDSAGP